MQTLLRFLGLALSRVFPFSSRRTRDERYLGDAIDMADFEQRRKRLDRFTPSEGSARLRFLERRH
jgi:hypothetical protein